MNRPTRDLVAEHLARQNAREALKQGIAITQAVMDQILYGVPGPLPAKPNEAKS